MPIGQKTTGQQYLDGELCFRLWVESKSLRTAAEIMRERGITNPIKGNAPTAPGIETAAKKWMIENPVLAREILLEANEGGVYDFAVDELEYYRMVLKYAQTVLGERAFKRLIDNPPYAEFVAA